MVRQSLQSFVALGLLILLTTPAGAQSLDVRAQLDDKLRSTGEFDIERTCGRKCVSFGVCDRRGSCIEPFSIGEQLSSLLYGPAVTNLDQSGTIVEGRQFHKLYTPFPYQATITAERIDRRTCCCKAFEFCEVKRGFLQVDGPAEVDVISITYDSPKYAGLPRRSLVRTINYRNCTNLRQSVTETITISDQLRNQLSFTKSITNARSKSVSITQKFDWSGAATTTGRMQLNYNESITLTESRSEAQTSTITRSSTTPLIVAPMYGATLEAFLNVYPAYVDGEVVIIADAPLTKNMQGARRVSEVLSGQDRTFTLPFRIEVEAADQLDVDTYPIDPVHCEREGLQREEREFALHSGLEVDTANQFLEGFKELLENIEISAVLEEPEPISVGGCCEASNDNDDARCSICCPPGEEASCSDATGAGTPDCTCVPE